MIAVHPEILEAITRSLVVGGPITINSTVIDAVSSFALALGTAAGPLQPIGGFRANGVFSRVLTHAALVSAHSVPLAGVDVQHASLLPLQSDTNTSRLIAALKDAIRLPGWVGSLLKWSGLITMIVGIIAYFVSPSVNNRHRGFAMATTGIVVAVIGFAFTTVINLIHYVLSG